MIIDRSPTFYWTPQVHNRNYTKEIAETLAGIIQCKIGVDAAPDQSGFVVVPTIPSPGAVSFSV
jgi:hypothetical protein